MTVGFIGHLHPVITTSRVGFNVKYLKKKFYDVSFRGFQFPFFIITVVIISWIIL